MIQRRLGALPLRFEGGDAFPQDVVEFEDAVATTGNRAYKLAK